MFERFHHPWLKLLTLIVLMGIGALLGQILVFLALGSLTENLSPLSLDTQAYKHLVSKIQVILASTVFIGVPLVYWRFVEKRSIRDFFSGKTTYFYPTLLTIGLVVSFMIVNTVFIQWNLNLKLPAFLAGFEQWALAKEAELKRLTTLLTTFHSNKALLISLLTMAIIPAIGEELLFRGILQNLFHTITQNIHLAIGITAFIFSAIHLQFYGFLPRFLLGALFGYIYWWTKDLSFSMIAHFFNNAFTLLLLFFQQKAWIQFDVENTPPPAVGIILFFSVLTVIFATTLRRLSRSS